MSAQTLSLGKHQFTVTPIYMAAGRGSGIGYHCSSEDHNRVWTLPTSLFCHLLKMNTNHHISCVSLCCKFANTTMISASNMKPSLPVSEIEPCGCCRNNLSQVRELSRQARMHSRDAHQDTRASTRNRCFFRFHNSDDIKTLKIAETLGNVLQWPGISLEIF